MPCSLRFCATLQCAQVVNGEMSQRRSQRRLTMPAALVVVCAETVLGATPALAATEYLSPVPATGVCITEAMSPGDLAAIRIEATQAATITSGTMLWSIAGSVGSSMRIYLDDPTNNEPGVRIPGELSYVSETPVSTGFQASYVGSIDVPAGIVWVAWESGSTGGSYELFPSPLPPTIWEYPTDSFAGSMARLPVSSGTWAPVVFMTGSDYCRPSLSLTSTPPSSGSGQAPPPVVQEVGMPTSGCDELTLPELNWSGVGGGGWHRSWSAWLNDGRGGPVCSRTLVYTSGGRWIVQS